jgi:hypothetical protein
MAVVMVKPALQDCGSWKKSLVDTELHQPMDLWKTVSHAIPTQRGFVMVAEQIVGSLL